jgi:hypothetical protein
LWGSSIFFQVLGAAGLERKQVEAYASDRELCKYVWQISTGKITKTFGNFPTETWRHSPPFRLLSVWIVDVVLSQSFLIGYVETKAQDSCGVCPIDRQPSARELCEP